jgi:hypothetical protein
MEIYAVGKQSSWVVHRTACSFTDMLSDYYIALNSSKDMEQSDRD